jgi:hypothetical protein
MYKKLGNDEAKFAINSIIGCWAKRETTAQKSRYTSDLSDAIRYYFSSKEATYSNHIVEGKQDLYEVFLNKTHKFHESLMPLYMQTIDFQYGGSSVNNEAWRTVSKCADRLRSRPESNRLSVELALVGAVGRLIAVE